MHRHPRWHWNRHLENLGKAKQELAPSLYHERKHTVAEICRLMGIGRSTLYNYLTEAAQ
nr:helix-turn-helix domain-containing protein [Pseudomonas sp. GL-B-16]